MNTNDIENIKTNKIKHRMYRRNILPIITICFWVYMAISLALILKKMFLEVDCNQVELQYPKYEIITEYIEATFPYIRTKKGEKINENLEELKNY